MNHILRQDGSELQWQPDSSDLPTDSSVHGCTNLHNTSSITLLPAVQSVRRSYTCWWMQEAQHLARDQVGNAHKTFH